MISLKLYLDIHHHFRIKLKFYQLLNMSKDQIKVIDLSYFIKFLNGSDSDFKYKTDQ